MKILILTAATGGGHIQRFPGHRTLPKRTHARFANTGGGCPEKYQHHF